MAVAVQLWREMIVGATLVFAAAAALPVAADIMAHVAEASARRHLVSYSGTRTYSMNNLRFHREAKMVVRMTYRPGEGKRFTQVERSGSDILVDVIQKLIDTEVEASRPGQEAKSLISPANYEARLRGSATVEGRECWVLDLKPRVKSRFLIFGTAWVDKATYGLVRLDGTTAASLSMWVGSPHLVEDRADVDGIWVPVHMRSRSSTFLTGDSELVITYTGYQIHRGTAQ